MTPIQYQLGRQDQGRRADKVVQSLLPEAPWSRIHKLFRQRRVTLDGRSLQSDERLRAPGQLNIDLSERAPGPLPPNPRIRLELCHQDDALFAIDKPAGLPVLPGPGHGTDTLASALLALDPLLAQLGPDQDYGLAHRLDRETSGLILVARQAEVRAQLLESFRERRVKKTYLALVHGSPREQRGEIELPVRHVAWRGQRPKLEEKAARTGYEVLERFRDSTLLRLEPHTGRTHQIRIHLASLGHPICGDRLYGAEDERGRRTLLHATALALPHPTEGGDLDLKCEPPRDFRRALSRRRRRQSRAGATPTEDSSH